MWQLHFNTNIHFLKKQEKCETKFRTFAEWTEKIRSQKKTFKQKFDAVIIHCTSSLKWNKTWWGILKGFWKPTMLFIVINLKQHVYLKSPNDFLPTPGALRKRATGRHSRLDDSLTGALGQEWHQALDLWQGTTQMWPFPFCCFAK